MVLRLIIAFILSCFCVLPLHAGGTYFVGRDEGGVYLQTNEHGGWYFEKADLRRFRISETGTYQTGPYRHGTYLFINKHPKYYIDLDASDKLDLDIEAFNREQERIANF